MNDTQSKDFSRKLDFLGNSHRFLREASEKARLAKSEPDQWMFAVAALVQSVELALKAALFEIHPVLIYHNIDSPNKTVSISTASSRLKSQHIGRHTFSEKDEVRLSRAVQIRNELTHSDFDINLAQIEANFHEVFAFVAEFNRRTFEIGIEDLIDPAHLVEFLENRKHHLEMLARAKVRIDEEGILPHLVRMCPYCTEDTFVQTDEDFRCYLCHHYEDIVVCQRCCENFLNDDMVDFSDHFEIDYSEGRSQVWNNYGFEYHVACRECASAIKEEIREMVQEDYYREMMEEAYHNQAN